MRHYLYKITNLINNHIYIGVHSNTMDFLQTNYYGSGLAIRGAVTNGSSGIIEFKPASAITNNQVPVPNFLTMVTSKGTIQYMSDYQYMLSSSTKSHGLCSFSLKDELVIYHWLLNKTYKQKEIAAKMEVSEHTISRLKRRFKDQGLL